MSAPTSGSQCKRPGWRSVRARGGRDGEAHMFIARTRPNMNELEDGASEPPGWSTTPSAVRESERSRLRHPTAIVSPRQQHAERRALPGRAVDLDPSAVGFDDPPHDKQPEPGTGR